MKSQSGAHCTRNAGIKGTLSCIQLVQVTHEMEGRVGFTELLVRVLNSRFGLLYILPNCPGFPFLVFCCVLLLTRLTRLTRLALTHAAHCRTANNKLYRLYSYLMKRFLSGRFTGPTRPLRYEQKPSWSDPTQPNPWNREHLLARLDSTREFEKPSDPTRWPDHDPWKALFWGAKELLARA